MQICKICKICGVDGLLSRVVYFFNISIGIYAEYTWYAKYVGWGGAYLEVWFWNFTISMYEPYAKYAEYVCVGGGGGFFVIFLYWF